MTDGWDTQLLGNLCDVLDYKRKPITKRDRIAGNYPYYGATGVLGHVEGYLFDEQLVLVGEDGAKWASGENTAFAVEGKIWVNNHAHVLRPNRTMVLDDWLIYYLNHSDLSAFVSGLTVPKLNQGSLREIPIPLPPLPEQHRIVGILDEAFAGIATATANAEKNLESARALFERQLDSVFSQRSKGWKEVPLGDLATFRNGINFTKSSRGELVKIVGVKDFQRHFFAPLDDLDTVTSEGPLPDSDTLKENDLLFVRSNGSMELIGRCLLVGEVHERVTHSGFTIRARLNSDEVIARYLCHFLKSGYARRTMIDSGTGTNIKSLNQTTLSALVIPVPSIFQQTRIVDQLEAMDTETTRLASIYQQKLAALDELKKSLLQQAFTGQLTAGDSIEVPSNVLPFPTTLPNITTTDLHAGVLAMAFEQHEKSGKETYFTHVKAEKIAHMIEAHLGLDLGRSPVKDAAGPNDFPHLRQVEHRARKANYFDFKRIDGSAYRVQKLRGFQRLIDKARTALGDRYEDVERLLNWMVPLKVRQAEIVATVFAAWNNLLLDGRHPTDEEIVFEARENWHPDKLKIDRQKFFAAVQWLREKSRVPEGRGKRVSEKKN